MSTESMILSNHLILCWRFFSSCLQCFPASGPFPKSRLFASGGQSTGALASVSFLPVNIQGWFPVGLTGLISLQGGPWLIPILAKFLFHPFFLLCRFSSYIVFSTHVDNIIVYTHRLECFGCFDSMLVLTPLLSQCKKSTLG